MPNTKNDENLAEKKLNDIAEKKLTEVSAEETDKPQGQEYDAGFEQWLVDGDRFIPITKTVASLPAGDYNIRYDRTYDKHVLVMRQPLTEDLLRLPIREFDEVLDDIAKFWASRARYDEYGYIYKRGILLFGAPGCGKSSLVALMTQDLIDRQDGVVINVSTSDDILAFDEIMKGIREIEPERRIIAVIEDIDNFVNERKESNEIVSKLLNILDGKMQFDNVVMIATTNYPEDLEERITNRPSRFDLRREIGSPRMAAREYYLRSKLKKSDLKKIDVEHWLMQTVGFTIDHLKELVCLVFVHRRRFEDALAEVAGMIRKPRLQNTAPGSKKNMGFKHDAQAEDDDREKQ